MREVQQEHLVSCVHERHGTEECTHEAQAHLAQGVPEAAEGLEADRAVGRPHVDQRLVVVLVFLNCCYLGDVAIVDAETGEVIDFRLGAK